MTFRVIFAADGGILGAETYITNTNGTGVTLLRDIHPTGSSVGFSGPGIGLGTAALFTASDGFSGTGAGDEVWRSDGTTAGTVRLADIQFGNNGSSPDNFLRVGAQVFFTADDGINGTELWRTDGTATGTRMVFNIGPGGTSGGPGNLVALGNRVVFSADDGAAGRELWISDGTEFGTQILADIETGADDFGGPLSSDPYLQQTAVVGSQLFFSAFDSTNGYELWVTDGTTGGTRLVRDIDGAGAGAVPTSFQAFNGRVYYAGVTANGGDELWRSDGTFGGTQQVTDLEPGADWSSPQALTVLGARMIFTADTFETGREIFVTDGTSGGTRLLVDISGNGSSALDWGDATFTRIGNSNQVVFAATRDDLGTELWLTDGTATGTRLVADIAEGVAGSDPTNFIAAGGLVYFEADDGLTGREIWVTDGTTAGTRQVANLRAGAQEGAGFVPIAVLDVNGPPSQPALSSASVAENSANGTLIGSLSATDPDGNALSYALTDSAGGRFAIQGNALVVAGPLDFETAASHQVTVQVSDGQGGITTRTFAIAVTNGNDRPGVPTLSSASALENSANGVIVGSLSASDPDGNTLSFALTDSAGGRFAIQGNALVVAGPLDFETAASHQVTVQVSDGQGGISSARLTVAVIDISDPSLGDDTLTGTAGRDTIRGLDGDDLIMGLGADDLLFGGGGQDSLSGGSGRDLLDGGRGRDGLEGGDGRDRLRGGSGDDSLTGGRGRDVLDGGTGADTFVWGAGAGRDRVVNFGNGQDRVDLTGTLSFGDLTETAIAGGVRLSFGANQLDLMGVSTAQVDAGDFLV